MKRYEIRQANRHSKKMYFGGMTADQLNAWVGSAKQQVELTPPTASIPHFLLMYLMSAENVAAGQNWFTFSARQIEGQHSNSTMPLYEIVGTYTDPYSNDSTSSAQATIGVCGDGDRRKMHGFTQPLNKYTSSNVFEFTHLQLQNEGKTLEQKRNEILQQAVRQADDRLAGEVSATVVNAKRANSNSTLKYIGNNIGRNNTARGAFATLPTFKTDGTVNPTGEIMMNMDWNALGIPSMDMVYFGGDSMLRYLSALSIACCQTGYNPAMLQMLYSFRGFPDYGVQNAFAQAGKPNAMLAYRKGSMQFVYKSMYNGKQRATPTMAYFSITSPMTGIVWDVIEKTKECTSNNPTDTVYTLQVFTTWTVLGYGDATNNDNYKHLKNVTGVFAYDLVTADTKINEIGDADISQAYQAKDIVQAYPTDYAQPTGAGVALRSQIVGNDLNLWADITQADGRRIASISWTVAGTPATDTTPYITVDNSTLTTGDTVVVSVSFNTGSPITATYTAP